MLFNKLSNPQSKPSISHCLFPLVCICISISPCQSGCHSPILCCSSAWPLVLVHFRFPSLFFLKHLHTNPRHCHTHTYPPLKVLEMERKVAKAWLWCQFINAAPRETAWMKALMPLENYPPGRGQVISHTAEKHSKCTHTVTDTLS